MHGARNHPADRAPNTTERPPARKAPCRAAVWRFFQKTLADACQVANLSSLTAVGHAAIAAANRACQFRGAEIAARATGDERLDSLQVFVLEQGCIGLRILRATATSWW